MSRKNRKPEPRAYDATQRQENNIAGPCTACAALLPQARPPRQQKTRVYAKKGAIRYCECLNCRNTWKVSIREGQE
jgi:hypothetical protein